MLAAPFLVMLTALTAVAFAIPLRPAFSVSEKRSLAEFPAFSTDTLISGEYFDGMTLWFSDTFPGRESWIKAAGFLADLRGIRDVTIYGSFTGADDIPPKPELKPVNAAPAAPFATRPPVVEETPPPDPDPVETSPPTESVEHWGGLVVDDDAEVIFGQVLQIGDSAFSYFGFSQYGSDRRIRLVNDLAEVMTQRGVTVYDILIPTSVGVLVSSEYTEKLKCSDQGATVDYIYSGESDNVKKVNVFNKLIRHNDEYIYFRTDHHWTALGAYYAYEQFCLTAGFEPVPLERYEKLEFPGFLGSFYWMCNQNSRLREDTLYAYDPPGNIEMKVTHTEGNTFPWPVLTDMSHSGPGGKYMTFIAGDNPLTTLTNNDLPDDAPNCAVIKESFGNPFAPYLTQHYKNVYVIDYRKYSKMKLRYFVDHYEISDVLLVENLAMAQGDGTLDLLEWLFSA